MKIGIATCEEKPNLTAGDQVLAACLKQKGIQVLPLIWSEPDILSRNWDAIVIRSVWDYHRLHKDFWQWLVKVKESSIRLINSSEIVRWNLNKSYLLELADKGISAVPSILIPQDTPEEKVLEQIRRLNWPEIVIKPTISATAFLTFRTLSNHRDLPEIINKVKLQSDILIQPYISSVAEEGEVSLIFFNDEKPEYSHSVLKRPQSGDFRVQSDFGGSVLPYAPSPELIRFAESCLKELPGEWTFARVDVIDWERSPLLGELEMIEPDLFLTNQPKAVQRLADLICKRLQAV